MYGCGIVSFLILKEHGYFEELLHLKKSVSQLNVCFHNHFIKILTKNRGQLNQMKEDVVFRSKTPTFFCQFCEKKICIDDNCATLVTLLIINVSKVEFLKTCSAGGRC